MKPKGGGELNGFLDRGSTYRGELEFEDTMRIDGRFQGKITSKNELIIGETARIDAEIHVGTVAISGTVTGRIVADERIEIHRGGRVYCDLESPTLVIEEGAVFQGSCAMPDQEKKASTLPTAVAGGR